MRHLLNNETCNLLRSNDPAVTEVYCPTEGIEHSALQDLTAALRTNLYLKKLDLTLNTNIIYLDFNFNALLAVIEEFLEMLRHNKIIHTLLLRHTYDNYFEENTDPIRNCNYVSGVSQIISKFNVIGSSVYSIREFGFYTSIRHIMDYYGLVPFDVKQLLSSVSDESKLESITLSGVATSVEELIDLMTALPNFKRLKLHDGWALSRVLKLLEFAIKNPNFIELHMVAPVICDPTFRIINYVYSWTNILGITRHNITTMEATLTAKVAEVNWIIPKDNFLKLFERQMKSKSKCYDVPAPIWGIVHEYAKRQPFVLKMGL